MAPYPEPLFLHFDSGPLGQRFALHHSPPSGLLRGLVAYVHPFAEEMNKSRRMAALQSRALAAKGFAVLQIDLMGCGDSPGDFGDATWTMWVDDVVNACRWLRQCHRPSDGGAIPPLWLWGLRVGCLLAAEAAAALDGECNFLFWQPTTEGKSALQQFLRLRLVAGMLGGSEKGAMAGLRAQLASGQSIEVAGYMLNPALATGLERAGLRPPVKSCRTEWIGISASPADDLPPGSLRTVEEWQQAGCQVRTNVVAGPAFWQTTEIEELPDLLTATLAAM
jgi:exosortase A-associated hydrolase 2